MKELDELIEKYEREALLAESDVSKLDKTSFDAIALSSKVITLRDVIYDLKEISEKFKELSDEVEAVANNECNGNKCDHKELKHFVNGSRCKKCGVFFEDH